MRLGQLIDALSEQPSMNDLGEGRRAVTHRLLVETLDWITRCRNRLVRAIGRRTL